MVTIPELTPVSSESKVTCQTARVRVSSCADLLHRAVNAPREHVNVPMQECVVKLLSVEKAVKAPTKLPTLARPANRSLSYMC